MMRQNKSTQMFLERVFKARFLDLRTTCYMLYVVLCCCCCCCCCSHIMQLLGYDVLIPGVPRIRCPIVPHSHEISDTKLRTACVCHRATRNTLMESTFCMNRQQLHRALYELKKYLEPWLYKQTTFSANVFLVFYYFIVYTYDYSKYCRRRPPAPIGLPLSVITHNVSPPPHLAPIVLHQHSTSPPE